MARENEIFDLPLPALAVGEQFRDVAKMVPRLVIRCLKGLHSPMYRGEGILPTGVTQRLLQITGKAANMGYFVDQFSGGKGCNMSLRGN